MKRINLLPKLKQRELAHERVLYSVSMAAIVGIAVMFLGVVVQFGVSFYLNRSLNSIEEQIEQLKRVANKSENAVVKEEIKTMNAQIQDFDKLYKETPQWSEVLEAFVQHVPQGVKITQFEADTETKKITVSGYSPTRDLVIDLYNNVNSDKEHFKSINYPLENVAKPVDVRFFYDIVVADGVLVEGSNP